MPGFGIEISLPLLTLESLLAYDPASIPDGARVLNPEGIGGLLDAASIVWDALDDGQRMRAIAWAKIAPVSVRVSVAAFLVVASVTHKAESKDAAGALLADAASVIALSKAVGSDVEDPGGVLAVP